MTAKPVDVRKGKVRTVLCLIAMVCGILTVVAISSALAIRLMEMGDPKESGWSPLHFLSWNEASVEADKTERRWLWILAFADLAFAIASSVLAIAAARTHSITIILLLLGLGLGTTVAAFYLVWPLGILAAVIPIMALCVLPMSKAQCNEN